MAYDLNKCPECGYVNNKQPDICPNCGCNLEEYRANIRAKMREEAQQAAEKERIEKLNEAYKQAIGWFNSGLYEEARISFMALGNYEDSVEFAEKCKEAIYQTLIKKFNDNMYLKNMMSQEEPFDYFQTPFVQSCREKYKPSIFKSIKSLFENYEDYKQSCEYMNYCDKAVELFSLYKKQEADYNTYCKAMTFYNEKNYKEALAIFQKLNGLFDSDEFVEKCQEAMYQQAIHTYTSGCNYEKALKEFEEIPTYRDASDYIRNAKAKISNIKRVQKEQHQAEVAEQCEKNRKDGKIHIAIYRGALALSVIFGIILFFNREQISIVSSFGWWCFGWIIYTLASICVFGAMVPDIRKDYKNIQYYAMTSGGRRKTSLIVSIVMIICTIIVFSNIGKINFEPTQCVTITATDKEDSIGGKYYDSVITFDLQNTSNLKVTYIMGEMTFYNGDNEVATYNVYFQGEYNAEKSYQTTIEFHDENSALYDVSFSNLKITYRITAMKFNDDYEEREYNGETVIIKELR